MAKPILIVKVNIPQDDLGRLSKDLSNQFYDYHVLVVYDESITTPVFETYNDCKGLEDVDIKKLIEDFNNG